MNPPPDVDLTSYPAMIIGRFSNAAIGDQLLRVAGDGAAKLPIFHGKTIATLLAAEADLGREAFLLACYGRYLDGHDDRGAAFSVFEPGTDNPGLGRDTGRTGRRPAYQTIRRAGSRRPSRI